MTSSKSDEGGPWLTVGDVKGIIRDTMDIGDDRVDEAFVAQPHVFNVKTERLSPMTLEEHEKLYQGYVGKFNETSAQLDTADRSAAAAPGSEFRSLKRIEVYTLNSMYLHELYFYNIGDPESVLYSDTMAYMRLDRDFGGVKRWQSDFIACAMSAREGWAVTCYNSFLKRYINVVIDGDDIGIPLGSYPIIVVDMWAHSYARDYGIEKKKYVRDMMRELNWNVIEDRIVRAERIADALK